MKSNLSGKSRISGSLDGSHISQYCLWAGKSQHTRSSSLYYHYHCRVFRTMSFLIAITTDSSKSLLVPITQTLFSCKSHSLLAVRHLGIRNQTENSSHGYHKLQLHHWHPLVHHQVQIVVMAYALNWPGVVALVIGLGISVYLFIVVWSFRFSHCQQHHQ